MSSKSTLLFFLLLIVIVPLGYSESIQDSSLMPKYILLVGSLGVSLFFSFKLFPKKTAPLAVSDTLLLLYFILSIPSLFTAINPSEAFYELSKLLLFIFVYFISGLLLKKDRDKGLAYISLFSVVASILVIVFCQASLFTALRSTEAFSASSYFVEGLNGHRNLLSAWLMLLVPLTAIGLFVPNKTPRLLLVLTIVIQLVFIILLQARAVYVGTTLGFLLLGGLLFFLPKPKFHRIIKKGLFLFCLLLSAALLFSLFSSIPQSLLASVNTSGSAEERVILWSKTLSLIQEQPFWGVGGGNWKILFPSQSIEGLYRAELNNVIFLRPHNDFLWIWIEQGFLSLVAYLAFVFSLLYYSFKAIKNNPKASFIIAACIAAVISYLGMSFFDFPKERIEHQVALAILLSILAHFCRSHQKTLSITIPKKPLVVISGIVLLCLAYYSKERYQTEVLAKEIVTLKDLGDNQGVLQKVKQINLSIAQVDNHAVPFAWYEGVANFNLGRKLDAARNFNLAVQQNPFNFNALNNAGTGFFVQKNYSNAEQLYKAALKVNPKFDDAKLNLTATYINTKQWQLAQKTLRSVSVKSQRSEQLKKLIDNHQ